MPDEVKPDEARPDEEAVLAVNQEFYRAFAARDLAAMDALWAEEAPVACVHPGWDALVGRDPVMESWAAILGGAGAPQIRCEAPRAFLLGPSAFVICHEVLEQQGRLIATNIFAHEQGRWRMVHHQAGPAGQPQPAPPTSERPTGTLH